MVLPCVNLLDDTTDAGTIVPNHDEQVFSHEFHAAAHFHYLDVRKTLPVRTDFILALHDEHAPVAQHPVCLASCFPVQFQNGFVVLRTVLSLAPVIGVILLERWVGLMGGASRSMHIRRVEDYTVDAPICIRKAPAVDAVLNVGSAKFVRVRRDVSPKDPFPVRHVCDDAARLYVQRQDTWKYPFVSFLVCAQNQFVGSGTVPDDTLRSLLKPRLPRSRSSRDPDGCRVGHVKGQLSLLPARITPLRQTCPPEARVWRQPS